MDTLTKKAAIWIGLAIIIIIGIVWSANIKKSNTDNQPKSDMNSFAQCLKDKGAVFYGAFWCTHCQAQKEAFGEAQKNLPYVECSTPDGQDQTQICKDKKIESYPTWVFPDGSKLEGEQSFDTLGRKTSCQVPE